MGRHKPKIVEPDELQELREQLSVLSERRKELKVGGFDPELTAATAQIVRAIVAVQNEQRQQRKAERDAMSELTPELIIARIREMEPDERAHVLHELGLVAEGKGLFG